MTLSVLFICSRNKWRSPTGEAMFRRSPGVTARSAGTSASARRKVSASDIQQADIIFVMEQEHLAQLRAAFRDKIRHKEIHVLDVPDEYGFMDQDLVEILEAAVTPLLEAHLLPGGA